MGFLDLGYVVVVITLVLAFTMLVVYIRSKRRSEQHTLATSFLHFALYNITAFSGWMLKRWFEDDTKNCSHVQEQTLMKILKENSDTVYGREYKLALVNNKHEFVASHPLTVYEHYESYIERVANGETNIMTSQPPKELASTSGTTGNRKLLLIEKDRGRSIEKSYIPLLNGIRAIYPQAKSLQKGALIFTPYVPKVKKSKGGLAITNGIQDQTKTPFYSVLFTSPQIITDIPTEQETVYVHLLFALRDRELGFLFSVFAMHFYTVMVSLQNNWENLVSDIGRGSLKEDFPISQAIKGELNKQLSPDPQRAEELRIEFTKGFDNTVIRRIWPHINFAMTITSGSAELYANKLREKYLDIPIISPFYISTEGIIATNVRPEQEFTPEYVLLPRAQFFEFIPIENVEEDQPKTLFAEEVQVGSMYELVITNCTGLYRFRLGDIVKISGFYNKAPILQYQYRTGQLLNIRAEKTSEKMMYEALQATLRDSFPSVEMVDYTCTESIMLEGHKVNKVTESAKVGQSNAPYYVIFVEFAEGQDVVINGLRGFATQLDENICDRNPMYDSLRDRGGINRIQVHVLRSGTFDQLVQFYYKRNPLVASRFKLPRLTKVNEGLELLLNNVV